MLTNFNLLARVPGVPAKEFPAWRFGILAFCLFLVSALGVRAQSPVEVRIDAAHPGAEIPANFLGLSFEMQRVLPDTNGAHFFNPRNRPLIALFKTLGIKSLRVGGNTADRPTLPVPAPADVDQLFAFAKAAGVKVIYTLRLNQGDPAADAQLADYITQHYARQLDCFSIGNEPNVFCTNFDVFITAWKRFDAEITAPANLPGARFCGPGVSPGHEKWSAQLAREPAAQGQLKYISQHDYAGGDARKVTDAAAARDHILSPEMEAHYAKFAANFVPAVTNSGLSWRFEEANSFYDGGAPEVSDTYASALWALNYQWWWARRGMSGINFHTGDKVAARDENKPCRYATFWTGTNGLHVHPIGYAEKMFSLGSQGRMLPVTVAGAGTNVAVAAYAVLGGDGKYYVTLINFSHGVNAAACAVQISADSIRDWRAGKIIRLATPDGDVARHDGVLLGGRGITDHARWPGSWETLFGWFHGHTLPITVSLPPASAAIIKLTPR